MFPHLFCAWALSSAAVRCPSGSSPEAVWDRTKSRLELHQDLSKETSKSRGFLILMSGNMLSWNTTCPRHDYPIYTLCFPHLRERWFLLKNILISQSERCTRVLFVLWYLLEKKWTHEQMEWEEMWKQWEEKSCFLPYRVVIDSWKQKDNSSLYSFQTTVRIFTSS